MSMNQTQPAISYSTYLADNLPYSYLIDSLPYADDFTENDQARAQALIDQEMAQFTKNDYLKDLPVPNVTYNDCPLFKNMLDSGEKCADVLDLSRYERMDQDNLDLVIGNAMLTNQNYRLLQEYGSAAWERHNEVLKAYKAKLENDIKQLNTEVQSINQSRKQAQSAFRQEISTLTQQQQDLTYQNAGLYRELKAYKEEYGEIEYQEF